jgi:transposase-like protein
VAEPQFGAGEVRNVSVLVAIGVNEQGYSEVLAAAEGSKEDKASWTAFLRHLKQRGQAGVKLFVSDKGLGPIENLAEFYGEARWQRCVVHFYRNVWTAVPSGKVREVVAMLKAIHAQEDREAAHQKADAVVVRRQQMKLAQAADLLSKKHPSSYRPVFFATEWLCLNAPAHPLRPQIVTGPLPV